MGNFIIQSHRGAGVLSTDNTLEAFELGWALGTIPEADVRTTADGVIVAFHDKSLQRMMPESDPVSASRSVAEVSWEELSLLDVGSWKNPAFSSHRIPRLREVLVATHSRPGRQLYLDVKEVDSQSLAALVLETKTGPQVILASSDYAQIRRWTELVPDGRTLLWMGTWGKDDDSILEGRFQTLREHHFSGITQLQIHAHLRQPLETIRRTSENPFSPSDAFFRQAARELSDHGILFQSLPWGGGTEEVYWKLLDLGVVSFASDHPDITLAAVKSYSVPT